MAFDVDGDAGTAVAVEDALQQIREGGTQETIDILKSAPPGPVETKWGLGYRSFAECWEAIQQENLPLKEGELRCPMRYSVKEEPSYSIVSSNALWKDPSKAEEQNLLRKDERDNGRTALYFPQTMRDVRQLEKYRPGLKPNSQESMDKLGVSIAHLESKCKDFYDHEEVEQIYYPEIEQLLLEFYPGATDALVSAVVDLDPYIKCLVSFSLLAWNPTTRCTTTTCSTRNSTATIRGPKKTKMPRSLASTGAMPTWVSGAAGVVGGAAGVVRRLLV
jgi:hypothetical protein